MHARPLKCVSAVILGTWAHVSARDEGDMWRHVLLAWYGPSPAEGSELLQQFQQLRSSLWPCQSS